MINSRKVEDLHPHVQKIAKQFESACKQAGIDIIFTSTYRDSESQSALYAQGRTSPGKKVTNAKAGQSYHNWKVAFDVVPIVNGKAIWNNKELWNTIGAIGVSLGLEWAGNWKSFKEMPHFQFTCGLTYKDFMAGRTLDEVLTK